MASANESLRQVVLVVEDEPLLRMHAVDLIEDAGFDTVEASSADEAVAILMARTDIRIVFTDIDMPGSMNGLKLAAAVRERWPPIDIIITSGLVSPTVHDMPARVRFFPKPYDDQRLVRALRAFAA